METEWIGLKRGCVIVRLRKGFAYNCKQELKHQNV